MTRRLRKGDVLFHRFNLDLGPGRVESVTGRHLVVHFPKTGSRLTLAADDAALRPVVFTAGQGVTVGFGGEPAILGAIHQGMAVLSDGRRVSQAGIWPPEPPSDPLERLAALDVDGATAFVNRLDGLLLESVRQARGLGSFLGGRIRIFPHQLHVAERATDADPVRWLLADEVGLGKTVEACLILSRLVRTGRAERTLVVTPASLTVQWLGELWRKFHQTFVLLDRKRREDVEKEHGAGFNPFEAHRNLIVALEDLAGERGLAASARNAGFDLLVVDEAHRLERRAGHPGHDAWRAVAPLAARSRHVLLLTATPLETDVAGFFDLLSLLRPDAYKSAEEFAASLAEGRPLPPATSATRRVDLGGLPPRMPLPVDLSVTPPGSGLTGEEKADLADPRVAWLAETPLAGKTLVFVHDLPTLQALKARLETRTRRRVAIFHEELTPERGDLEVAEFRREGGPPLLVSTEAGGEGRNFEFCRRLVLFDLPTDPAAVEQRIGRLDRINRMTPVEIVYFRPPDGFGRELVALYERIGLFREPLGGLERSLSHVEEAVRKAERFYRAGQHLPVDELAVEVLEATRKRQEAVYHHLHVGGYRAEMAEGILSRIPPDLDERMEEFVLGAARLFDLEMGERAGVKTVYLELGGDALVEHLPGVPSGSRFLGTFDREEAVLREEIDFFSSGHPLVEGLFAELADGSRGCAAVVKLAGTGISGTGILFVFRSGSVLDVQAFGLDGTPRPAWAKLLVDRRHDLKPGPPDDWRKKDWPAVLTRVAAAARERSTSFSLDAVAAFRLRP
ncbi:MAG: SNF2-related protein [Thermoanaerobaculia bacterium]